MACHNQLALMKDPKRNRVDISSDVKGLPTLGPPDNRAKKKSEYRQNRLDPSKSQQIEIQLGPEHWAEIARRVQERKKALEESASNNNKESAFSGNKAPASASHSNTSQTDNKDMKPVKSAQKAEKQITCTELKKEYADGLDDILHHKVNGVEVTKFIVQRELDRVTLVMTERMLRTEEYLNKIPSAKQTGYLAAVGKLFSQLDPYIPTKVAEGILDKAMHSSPELHNRYYQASTELDQVLKYKKRYSCQVPERRDESIRQREEIEQSASFSVKPQKAQDWQPQKKNELDPQKIEEKEPKSRSSISKQDLGGMDSFQFFKYAEPELAMKTLKRQFDAMGLSNQQALEAHESMKVITGQASSTNMKVKNSLDQTDRAEASKKSSKPQPETSHPAVNERRAQLLEQNAEDQRKLMEREEAYDLQTYETVKQFQAGMKQVEENVNQMENLRMQAERKSQNVVSTEASSKRQAKTLENVEKVCLLCSRISRALD